MCVVNPYSPIIRSAMLNRGLLRWWMALPFRHGPPRLEDLLRKSPMTLSGALRLGPRGRPGGFGSSVFDGTDDFGQTAAIDLSGITTMSIAFWMYWDAFADNNDIGFESSAAASTAANVGGIQFVPNESATSTVMIRVRCSTTAGNAGMSGCYLTRPSAAAWHHWVICINRSAGTQQVAAVYIDGVSQSLTPHATSVDNTSTGGFGNHAWNFMSRAGTSLFAAGRLDDFRICDRVIRAWEPRALMHASRRGYPQELRWSRPATELLSTDPAGGGGATNSFWLRSRGRPCWPQTE